MLNLRAKPLIKADFAAYGDVIETTGARHFPINAGTIERFHDLARVEVDAVNGGRPVVSIVRCNQASALPCRVGLVERHRLGSQAFIPLGPARMIVVVAESSDSVEAARLAAFVSDGKQGVNYHPGVWHMPLIAFEPNQEFLVVDRGDTDDCEEIVFDSIDVLVDVDGRD